MHNFTMIRKNLYIHKIITFFVLISFIVFNIVFSKGFAQSAFSLTNLGAINAINSAFTPTMLRGIIVDPNNPFEFDFIIDPGDDNLTEEDFNQASEKLIRYFLASLTIPEDDLWVNLSPYEQDRIIPESFSHTEMGIDLLSQDYLLKQITASLLNPDDEIGKEFWDNVYKNAYKKYGTTSVAVDAFNKVWIIPDQAVIYESKDRMFIIESRLKVLLEQDYLAQQSHRSSPILDGRVHESRSKNQELASSIMRDVIIPELEREVNQGKNFAKLRQIYHSFILAAWFKETLKDSILNQVYSDQGKTRGLDVGDYQMPSASLVDAIYAQYLQAYKKGVVDTIRVEYDPYIRQNIPRKYFSGGVALAWRKVKGLFRKKNFPSSSRGLKSRGLKSARVRFDRQTSEDKRDLWMLSPEKASPEVLSWLLNYLQEDGKIYASLVHGSKMSTLRWMKKTGYRLKSLDLLRKENIPVVVTEDTPANQDKISFTSEYSDALKYANRTVEDFPQRQELLKELARVEEKLEQHLQDGVPESAPLIQVYKAGIKGLRYKIESLENNILTPEIIQEVRDSPPIIFGITDDLIEIVAGEGRFGYIQGLSKERGVKDYVQIDEMTHIYVPYDQMEFLQRWVNDAASHANDLGFDYQKIRNIKIIPIEALKVFLYLINYLEIKDVAPIDKTSYQFNEGSQGKAQIIIRSAIVQEIEESLKRLDVRDFAMTVHNEAYVPGWALVEQLIKPFPEDQDFQEFVRRINERKINLSDLQDALRFFEDYQRSGKEIPWLYLNLFADPNTFPFFSDSRVFSESDQRAKEKLVDKVLFYKDALFQYASFQEILNPEDFSAQAGTIINYFKHFQEEFDAQDLRKIAKEILESLAPAFRLTGDDISLILNRIIFLWIDKPDEIQKAQKIADRNFVVDEKGRVSSSSETLQYPQEDVRIFSEQEDFSPKEIFSQGKEITRRVLAADKAKILSHFDSRRGYSENLVMLNGQQIESMADVFDRLTSELGHAIHFYLLDKRGHRQYQTCPVVEEIFDGLARRLRTTDVERVEYNWYPGLILYRLLKGVDRHLLRKWFSEEGGLEQIENKIYAITQDSDQVRRIRENPSMVKYPIAFYILHKMSDLAGSDQRAAAVISVMLQDADEDSLAWNRDFRIFLDHFKKALNNKEDRINEILSKQYPLVKLDANEVGGIDFTSRSLEFKRQQDSSPVEIKVDNFENFEIDGLHPVIIHVTPIVNLPLLLGVVEEAQAQQLSLTH